MVKKSDKKSEQDDLWFFSRFSYEKLVLMGKIYYGGKATEFQKNRYEKVREGLLRELRMIFPEAPDSGTACYIHAAIKASLQFKNKEELNMQDLYRNAASNAHNNLPN